MPHRERAETAAPRLVREVHSVAARLALMLLNFCLILPLAGAAALLTLGFAFIGDAPVERQGHFIRWTLAMIASGGAGTAASAWVLYRLVTRRQWWWGVQLLPCLVLVCWALFLPADMW